MSPAAPRQVLRLAVARTATMADARLGGASSRRVESRRRPPQLSWSWDDHDSLRPLTVVTVLACGAAAAMAIFGLPPVDLHGPWHYLGVMDPLCGMTRASGAAARPGAGQTGARVQPRESTLGGVGRGRAAPRGHWLGEGSMAEVRGAHVTVDADGVSSARGVAVGTSAGARYLVDAHVVVTERVKRSLAGTVRCGTVGSIEARRSSDQ